MFDPKLIFALLWGSQILLHIIFSDSFVTFDFITWLATFFTFVAFNLGAWFILRLKNHNLPAKFPALEFSKHIDSFASRFLILYLIMGCLVSIEIYFTILSLSGGSLSLPGVRQIVVEDFLGERRLNALFKFYYFGVGFCLFLLAFSKQLSRKKLMIIILIGLVSAILTTGRLYLLLFFCASTALLYRNKIITGLSVLYAVCAFFLLFFFIAILLNKGGDVGGTLDSVLWNMQVYTMSSLSCFNNFVVTDVPRIDGGALIPNSVRDALNLLGLSLAPKPNLLPFAEVPIQCNTYTVLFPLFHDGNLAGVFFGMFLIGAFHQYLYLKFVYSNKVIWWYLYSLSLYPLVMSVFEDAYFSSPGFWLLLYVPPLLLSLYMKVRWKKQPY